MATSITYSDIGATVQNAGGLSTITKTNTGSGYTILTITDISNTTNVTFSNSIIPYVIIVGGGGGGGYAKSTFEGAGGGGGGEVIILTNTIFSAGQQYAITVGKGGNGGVSASTSATSGGNTIIAGNFTVTSYGGGFGASSTGTSNETPGSGGSGGGANAWYVSGVGVSSAGGTSTAVNYYGADTSVYGNAGGAASWGGAGGGGGGATSAGGTNTTYTGSGGNGGAGGGSYSFVVNGYTVGNYGGGGGGGGVGSTYTVSLYGAGGGTNCGGAGGNYNTNATAGTAGTGGGGGGGGGGNGTFPSGLNGAGGGRGIVMFAFPNTPCFKLDTKILTNRGYRKIQHLRKGDLVKTFRNGFVPIHAIGTSEMTHSISDEDVSNRRRGCWLSNRLFRLTADKYPELFEDLVLTGYHSVLVDEFHGIEKTETRGLLGDIYLTDNFYRLPACIDRRASIYEESGRHRIYHLALENDDYYGNYGIYANGLLVESCCKRYLLEFSNMKLLT